MSHPKSHDHEQSRSRKFLPERAREGRAADLDWGQAVSTRVAVPAIACSQGASRHAAAACGHGPTACAATASIPSLEIVNVNFESKCSIYVQHNLLTLFNCSPRLLLLLFRTFWNCSVLLLFTYRIVDRIGLAVTGSIGDRSEYCRRQLDGNHTN